jgi:hypothetical protein
MTMRGLWLFRSADRDAGGRSVAVLDKLKAEGHDITVRVFAGAGHRLIRCVPGTTRYRASARRRPQLGTLTSACGTCGSLPAAGSLMLGSPREGH